MRQSFEHWLCDRHSNLHYNDPGLMMTFNEWTAWLSKESWFRYAEQWSSQQTEDEVKRGMAFVEKSIEQEVTELVHATFGGAEYYNSFIPKLLAILAKRKERE